VNNKKVDNSSDLRNHVGMLRVGDKVTFEILRAGKRRQIEAMIGEVQAEKKAMSLKNPRLGGATFAEIDQDSPFYGQVKGVLVLRVERGGRSWKNGLRDGDVVTSVNKEPINDLQEFLAAVNQDNNLLFRIRRGNSAAYLIMK
jgi:serine protease Do/serine protease DegQ